MKNIFLSVIAIATILFACDSSKNENGSAFTINGEIIGVEDSTPIYLQLIRDGKLESVDSAYIKSSSVSFKGNLDAPEMIYLKIGNTRKMVNLFGENSSISLKVNIDNLDQAKVTGSKSHDDLMAFKKFMEPINEKTNKLNEEYQQAASNSDVEKINVLRERYEVIRQEQIAMIKNFVIDKSESFFSPFIIRGYLASEMEYLALDSLLSELSPMIHSSKDFQALSERVNKLKSVEVGMPAVDFALSDTTGNPIAISAFQGKILLIDFLGFLVCSLSSRKSQCSKAL